MCGILFTLTPSSPSSSPPDVAGLLPLISRRGPDCTGTHTAVAGAYSLRFTSSVLGLRGGAGELTAQPLVDEHTGSVLCWNGEAWRIGGVPLEPGVNDAAAVFRVLVAAGSGAGLKTALEGIEGPYAMVFYDAVSRRVWYGRDVLGRRSLLRRGAPGGAVVVASVGDGDDAWKEVDAGGVEFVDLVTGAEGRVPYMWADDAAAEGRAEYIAMPFPKLNTATTPAGPLTPTSPETTLLHTTLLSSVRTRLLDIPPPPTPSQPRLSILFSGGLDCAVLARLAHECLPPTEPITLLNIAFENPRVIASHPSPTPTDHYENCPDRITGRRTLSELTTTCPGRPWIFTPLNIPHHTLLQHRQTVITLMHPHDTAMDLSISLPFYFLSLLSPPSTRILLSGLGADELLGGYARHRTAQRFRGAPGLLQELQLDLERLGRRNLGRDDRVLAHAGRECRYPYLDERVVGVLVGMRWEAKCGKEVLRCLAGALGMAGVAAEGKRAVQFGCRSARMEKGEGGRGAGGSKVRGKGM